MRREGNRTWTSRPLRPAASVAIAVALLLLAASSGPEGVVRPTAGAPDAGTIAWRPAPAAPIPSRAAIGHAVAPDLRDLPIAGYVAKVGAASIHLRHDPASATAPRPRPCVGV